MVFEGVIVKEGVCVEEAEEELVFVMVCVTVPDCEDVVEGVTELEAVTEAVRVGV